MEYIKNILYLSCYPDEYFNKCIASGINMSQPAQKFNKLIVKGFVQNFCSVDVVVFQKNTGNNIPANTSENYSGHKIRYYYCDMNGGYIKRRIQKRVFIYDFIKTWINEHPQGVLVVDTLKSGALDLSRYFYNHGKQVVFIVTDFMEYLVSDCKNLLGKIHAASLVDSFYKQFNYADILILLTSQMKEKLSYINKKTAVMEGLCDIDLTEKDDDIGIHPVVSNTFLYSGAISKQFGLQNLVKAFISANISGYELHLYGNGDYVDELRRICKSCESIKYFGTVNNENIMDIQKQAKILVNPRPTNAEYTKYSFPSKIIEYMTSGRPLVTTRLPGIPDEYDEFIYHFDNDGVEEIARKLYILSEISDNELTLFGSRAKRFILDNKNNKDQVARILKLLD